MRKLHLIMKKEEIDEEKIKDSIAVVFDVLLATSTMIAGLYHGAKEFIPVLDGDHAFREMEGREKDSYLLVGEYEGRTIDGFLSPTPLSLREHVKGKTVILSTTNGTVAVQKASKAKKVFISALLNGQAAADKIRNEFKNETIILICSGSSNSFCIEDFYGAGYFMDCFLKKADSRWELTDAAQAALQFYQGNREKGEEILLQSRVGKMISNYGFEDEISFVAQHGILSVIPYLQDKKIILE